MTKAALSKEDFRRLMKERAAKKIESPFAKYDSAGQLTCTLCKVPVKSEAFWTAHLNGKQHLQAQNPLSTSGKSSTTSVRTLPGKRPNSPDRESNVVKKTKMESISSTRQPTSSHGTTSVDKVGLPEGFFDGPEVVSTDTEMLPPKEIPPQRVSLPDNFFDRPNKNTQQKIDRDKKTQQEEEWARFQKEIQEESHKSAVVVEMEDDDARKQRELEELEEQMERWKKIVDLERKKESVGVQVAQIIPAMEISTEKQSQAEDEEEDFEFLDWRKRRLW